MANSRIDQISVVAAHNYERRLNRLYQEKSNFTSNINIFLVSQSMFILAYITVLNIENASYLNWVFAIIGCIVASMFLIVFYDQSNHLRKLVKEMEEKSDSFEESNKYFLNIFGIILPLVFIIIWIIFIGFYFTL